MPKKKPNTYWFVGYNFVRPGGVAFGFGRCFVNNLYSLPKLEASLAKEGGFSGVSIISMTPLTKAQYGVFKKQGFK